MMKRLLVDLLFWHLRSLGAFRDGQTLAEAMAAAQLLPVYREWLRECARILEREGYLERRGERFAEGAAPALRFDELERRWQEERARWRQNPDLAHGHALLEATVLALPDILTGKRAATEVIFPNGSVELVESAYKTSPMADYFNRVLALQVAAYVQGRATREPAAEVRILEIGAGTGSTSAFVFDALARRGLSVKEYCYTDISRAFLIHAERAYGPANPFLTCRILNVEKSLEAQGFDVGGYDVVVAANVLHATRNIRRTLRNAKAALKRGGLLFLNELTSNTLYNHLTFGLLEGWWLYDDPELRYPGSPSLPVEAWRHALEAERYVSITFPCLDAADLGQQVIVAESDGVVLLPAQQAAPGGPVAGAAPAPGGAGAPAGKAEAPGGGARPAATDRVARVIVEELAKSLQIDRGRIQPDEPFSTYGLDSILAVQLTQAINDALGIDLDITVMFEHNTVVTLRDHIASAFDVASAPDATDAAPPEPARAGDTAELPPPDAVDRAAPPAPAGATVGAPAERRAAGAPADGFAIIGMSGQFPQADDLAAFWRLLEQGRRCITNPPWQRADWRAHAGAGGAADGTALWGAFLERVHEFDPLFFGVSMAEARQMTPEQRLMLMAAWNAIEDAGYTPRGLAERPTGVFVGAAPSEYRPAPDPAGGAGPGLLGTPALSMIPNRISYALNLHGPSECCETACSSSLVALHRALQSIERGECAQAIVGGVNLVASPAGFAGMQAVGMLSPSGTVRPFQPDADGTARGEGVGAIVVKPLRDAIADGDFIYAVVKGTGVAHGGKGVSLAAPNIRGMKAAILQAYERAQVDPATVSYIEAHGMSSALADGAEIAALGSSLQALSAPGPGAAAPAAGPIYVSNLKPCIGHTEAFSGLAALMKVVLALRHRVIPAIAGFGRPSDRLPLEGSRLAFATQNTPWPAPTAGDDGRVPPRRASVNGFGIGGVNAHVVLEEYVPAPGDEAAPGPASPHVFVLSAADEGRLRERARALAAWLEGAAAPALADVAYTLQHGREAMDCRLAIVASSRDELARALGAWLDGAPDADRRRAFATGERRNDELIELCSTEAGAALIRSFIAERKLETVASYWAKGAPVDWGLLHQGARRRRVPLPGYPFERINCSDPPDPASAPRASLGAAVAAPQGPRSDVTVGPEEFVVGLVASALGLRAEAIDRARPLDRYGLNSLLTVTLLNHIRSAFPAFQPAWLQPHATLNEIVARLVGGGATWRAPAAPRFPELLHLNDQTRGRPVFWVHGALGSVETFREIARRCRRPFYAIQARGFMTKDAPIEGVQGMASYYIDALRSVQPEGPYDVGGFCLGGIISYEMTRQLQLRGEAVDSLVMVDSPDNTGFSRSQARGNISSKNAALQVVNALLWPASEKSAEAVFRRLIHQSEVDSSLDDDAFVGQLAELAVARGLSMTREAVLEFLQRNLRVQVAYRLDEFVIQPLAQADAVSCTYFRNRKGLFYGDLGSYYKVAGDPFSLDQVNYWQDWERELKRLRIIDIESSNHMTILHDDSSLRVIGEVCEGLYAT
ncbi:MAG TPA: beta-ketoacyl synthase N-terminal-like domain-containing protein [Polyangiaceae bacterium]|nr:beta-ketoacyl synthase N-terminal-like domain-containing protein [Polyangiaceae bacterium]